MSLYFSLWKNLIEIDTLNQIITMMKNHHLNIYVDKRIDIGKMVEYMKRDKKSSSKSINLVLLCDVEKPYQSDGSLFFQTSPDELMVFLDNFLKNYIYQKSNCWEYLKRDKIDYSKEVI
mgnify:CR=1 FL=1